MSESKYSPTMRLRWAEFYRHDRDETPAASVPGWPECGPSQFKLQQFWQIDGSEDMTDPAGEWRDIEVSWR